TAEGAVRLKAELAQLTGPEREDLAKRLKSAIQEGDLSENADYHKAKEDQGFLEGKIQELEYILQHAIIIEDHDGDREKIDIGAHFTIQEDDHPPETFSMVGAVETDPRNGRISNESPIGRAVIGRRVGDTVVVETPNGQIHLKILSIE
ncbi:MAG TPA: transcription elongation factor GreA, partial [Anaerolineales bacterium]|nr:transcription elongation factor GreA [Anaerolineales bacterium]